MMIELNPDDFINNTKSKLIADGNFDDNDIGVIMYLVREALQQSSS